MVEFLKNILSFLLALYVLIRFVLHKTLGVHYWKYRNPYDRVCQICDKHQSWYMFTWINKRGWWEDMF